VMAKVKVLYIGNLRADITEEMLRAVFQQFGELIAVTIARDAYTRMPRGFAFVEYKDREGARRGLSLNDTEFAGQKLHVTLAKPPPARRGGFRGAADASDPIAAAAAFAADRPFRGRGRGYRGRGGPGDRGGGFHPYAREEDFPSSEFPRGRGRGRGRRPYGGADYDFDSPGYGPATAAFEAYQQQSLPYYYAAAAAAMPQAYAAMGRGAATGSAVDNSTTAALYQYYQQQYGGGSG